MAHEIETMFYANAKPWHGIGTKLDGDALQSVDQVLQASGLDWEVEKVPMVTADTQQPIPESFATRRKSDNSILGVVGDRYTILQNHEALNWFNPWLESKQASMETAGSLRNGSRIFMLAKLSLDPMDIVPNDPVESYVLLSHSHDGSLSCRVGFTPIRVVCANTLKLAVHDKASKLIRVKHSKSIHDNLANIQAVMNLAKQEFEATAEQYRRLARRGVNSNDISKYIKRVLGVTEDKPAGAKMANIITDIWSRIEGGKGNDMLGVKGTAWGMYNGLNEWLNYERGHTAASRLDSLWYGPNAAMNQTALDYALELCV
jgi:phage/plasmid-like protein (TIGR03299 family)